jgi:hypothetical protein
MAVKECNLLAALQVYLVGLTPNYLNDRKIIVFTPFLFDKV